MGDAKLGCLEPTGQKHRPQVSTSANEKNGIKRMKKGKSEIACKYTLKTKRQSRQHTMKSTLKRHVVFFVNARVCKLTLSAGAKLHMERKTNCEAFPWALFWFGGLGLTQDIQIDKTHTK